MCRSAGAENRAASTTLVALVVLVAAGALSLAGDDEPETPAGVVAPLAPRSNEPNDARVALGEKLFADTRMSIDGTMACASCHLSVLALTDGRPVSVGLGGRKLVRNAPTLLNVGLVNDLFWDGRAPSLEEQARQPVLHPDELGWPDPAAFAEHMQAIEEYPPLFEDAFGSDRITLQRVARALAAYERTLLSGAAAFDRWWAGDEDALSAAQQRGYRLFVGDAGCAQCHAIRQSYATFSDGRFHNTGAGKGAGRADPGREGVTKRAEDRGAFRTPTLRNVALTGPYMHDGSLATLEEVVDFYVDGGVENPNLSALMRPLELDDADRGDLIAFLRSLTSAEYPRLAECDELLAQGRPREALRLFRAELERRPDSTPALTGVARAALALGEREPLLGADGLLRARLRADSPDGSRDGEGAMPELLTLLGRVSAALAPLEDAMAVARAEDALLAWARVRHSAARRDDTLLLEAGLLEEMGRRAEAVTVLEERLAAGGADATVRTATAAARYRKGWRAVTDGRRDDESRADFARAAELFDALRAEGAELSPDDLLFRAYARHYLEQAEAARDAYADAVAAPAAAERALSGLRNLLARDLLAYRALLGELAERHPDSCGVLYHLGYERLQERRFDEAEAALRRRVELEPTPTAGPRYYLARVARARGDREGAVTEYAAALEIDPNYPRLVAEFEGYVRSRPLRGFDDVDALLSDYSRFIGSGPADARFQCFSRNNLAFLLRGVAESYASRGAARIHTFPAGVPEQAREIAALCLQTYEEAAALVPADVADLPFAERWLYAGVLNDTGLLLHYFADLQDLERAEQFYLRAFELTGGAYQDVYFYNLQFLYGFELDGREQRWFELAEIAKDAILKEDPGSPTGFSPDPMKRRAARRDWERLSAALGR